MMLTCKYVVGIISSLLPIRDLTWNMLCSLNKVTLYMIGVLIFFILGLDQIFMIRCLSRSSQCCSWPRKISQSRQLCMFHTKYYQQIFHLVFSYHGVGMVYLCPFVIVMIVSEIIQQQKKSGNTKKLFLSSPESLNLYCKYTIVQNGNDQDRER